MATVDTRRSGTRDDITELGRRDVRGPVVPGWRPPFEHHPRAGTFLLDENRAQLVDELGNRLKA